MASKKITQLPPAPLVNSTSLFAVVTEGVTEKVALSQLPTGITSVDNLGGGSTIGAVLGSQLQLKTLVPGIGLSFTTTTNTITINTILSINSIGAGLSLINSFSNPNLSLKSITGSNGITVTDNTTSINIASSINNSVDSIIGLIEIPGIKTYKLDTYINRNNTINKLFLQTSGGTATVRLITLDNTNVPITTSNTFTANITRSENIINSFTCLVGQQLVLEVLTNTNCLDLSFTIDLSYTS